MKKLTVFIILCNLTLCAYAKYSGGTGEPNDPYLIGSPEDLNSIGLDTNDWDKHFLIISDINMAGISGTQFNIIGYWSDYADPNKKEFSGSFDGGGYTIFNLSVEENSARYTDLFGYIDGSTAEVKNLCLFKPCIKNISLGVPRVGALTGVIIEGSISNCYIIDANVEGLTDVGGIAGINGGQIVACEVTGFVLAQHSAGGLVGANSGNIMMSQANVTINCESGVGIVAGNNYGGTIEDCYAIGIINGTNLNLGGIVGLNNQGIIRDCFADVNVIGVWYVGGFVGENYRGEIYSSFAKGIVSGEYEVGGFVGYNVDGFTIRRCLFEGKVIGETDVGGFAGFSNSPIENSYCKANVEGNQSVGGFIGYCLLTPAQRLVNCFSISTINGNNKVGAFLGRPTVGSSVKCYWDKTIAGDVNGLGEYDDPNIIGLPTTEMQKRSTFADAGWDMVNIWDIGENQTYPFLRTHLPSDMNKDEITNLYDLAILAENWMKE